MVPSLLPGYPDPEDTLLGGSMLLLGLRGKAGFGSSAWEAFRNIQTRGFVFDLQSCNLHDPK